MAAESRINRMRRIREHRLAHSTEGCKRSEDALTYKLVKGRHDICGKVSQAGHRLRRRSRTSRGQKLLHVFQSVIGLLDDLRLEQEQTRKQDIPGLTYSRSEDLVGLIILVELHGIVQTGLFQPQTVAGQLAAEVCQ